MDNSWDSLTPKEIRNVKIFTIVFIITSILILFFLNEIVGKILLAIGVFFGVAPFILSSKGLIKNKINVLKAVEPGYNNWEDEEIEKQIKAIEDCGYKWFEQKNKDDKRFSKVGFKHTKTGLYLKPQGLNFYEPSKIKSTYEKIWSKDDPEKVKSRSLTNKKLSEAISSGATDEEIESIFDEFQKK